MKIFHINHTVRPTFSHGYQVVAETEEGARVQARARCGAGAELEITEEPDPSAMVAEYSKRRWTGD